MLLKRQKHCVPSLPASISSKLLVSHFDNNSLYLLGHDVLSTKLFIYLFQRVVNVGKLDSLCNIFPQKGSITYILGSFLAIFSNDPALNKLCASPAPPHPHKAKPEQRFYMCSPWQNSNKLCRAPVVPASWLIAFVSYISKQPGTLITFCNTKLLWFTLSLPLSTLIVFLLATYNFKHLLKVHFYDLMFAVCTQRYLQYQWT